MFETLMKLSCETFTEKSYTVADSKNPQNRNNIRRIKSADLDQGQHQFFCFFVVFFCIKPPTPTPPL